MKLKREIIISLALIWMVIPLSGQINNEIIDLSYSLENNREISITGQVTGSDSPDSGIAGASVRLTTGEANFETVTDIDGYFTITGLLGYQTYDVLILKTGYFQYTGLIETDSFDLDLGVIIIQEIPFPPINVCAMPNIDNTSVEIFWDTSPIFDYYFFDFEENDGDWLPTATWNLQGDWEWTDEYDLDNWYYSDAQVATPPATAHSGTGLWGTVINTNHTNSGGYSYLSRTFNFMAFSSTILSFWSWNDSYGSFDFGQVRVNGDLVWGPSWNYQNTMWQEVEIDLSAYDGLDQVEIVFEHFATSVIAYAGWYIDDVYVGPEIFYQTSQNNFAVHTIESLSNYSKSSSRILEGYRIYRFLHHDFDYDFYWEELATVNDTIYTDQSWNQVQSGFYRFAVKAEYTNGQLSSPAISNWVGKDMTTSAIVNVFTDTGYNAAGALVYLAYQNQDPDNNSPVYDRMAIGAYPAAALFLDILKGTYNLQVTYPGYTTYTESSINIIEPVTIELVISEIAYPPRELTCITGNNFVYLEWQPPSIHSRLDVINSDWDNVITNRSLLGYNIYRDDIQLNTELLSGTSYYDTTVLDNISYLYYVTAVYTLAESEPSNTVTALPGPNQLKIVGEDTTTTNTLPMNFFFRNSVSQTIYMADEINMAGLITELRFYYNFTQDIMNKPLKIWIGETNQADLLNDWIPSTQLDLVFDGTIDLTLGQNVLIISLDNFYFYDGEHNLIVMINRLMDTQGYNSTNHFYYSLTNYYPNRSRNIQSNTAELDPADLMGGTLTNRLSNIGITFLTAGVGTLDGYVYDELGQILPDVIITIVDTGLYALSNYQGLYLFPFIEEGLYSISAAKYGYYDSTIDNVLIEEFETTTLNFNPTPLPTVNLYGRIVGSDQPDSGLDNVFIYLAGYSNHEVYTNQEGLFFFSDIYADQQYLISIEREGYQSLTQQLLVGNTDLDLGDIVMIELTFPPYDVTATIINDNQEVYVDWSYPVVNEFSNLQNNEIIMFPSSIHYSSSNYPTEYIRTGYLPDGMLNTSDDRARGLIGFVIYRLSQGMEQNPNTWSEIGTVPFNTNTFIDTGLPELLNGNYRYAVRSVYTNNILSEAALSNIITYIEHIPEIANLEADVSGNDVYLTWEWLTEKKELRINRKNEKPGKLSGEQHSTREFIGFVIERNGSIIAENVIETEYFDVGLVAGSYSYSVIGVFTNGSTNMIFVEAIIQLNTDQQHLPELFATKLIGNHPNPFNAETSISYSLEFEDFVTIEVFNLKGQLVRRLLNDQLSAGRHTISWDGKDYRDKEVGSGIFLYRMQTGDYNSINKMILLK